MSTCGDTHNAMTTDDRVAQMAKWGDGEINEWMNEWKMD